MFRFFFFLYRERGLKVLEDIAPTQVGNFKVPLLQYVLGKYLKILSWKILDQRLAPIFYHNIVHFFVDSIAANWAEMQRFILGGFTESSFWTK